MSFVQILFYVFAALAGASCLVMVFTKNVLYAAFSLLVTLLSLAAIYVILFADFVAVAQLMIYVGGVLVLILFGIMISGRDKASAVFSLGKNMVLGSLVAGLFLAGLVYLIFSSNLNLLPGLQPENLQPLKSGSSVYHIGIAFMTTFAAPFEVVSLVLLAALAGAAFISAGKKNA